MEHWAQRQSNDSHHRYWVIVNYYVSNAVILMKQTLFNMV